jgi:hypothetical protein
MKIELTRDEMMMAANGGVLRQIDALLKRRQDQFRPPDPWKNHIYGALGEMALAKARDHYWFPAYDHPSKVEADVGKNWQVRSHDRPNGELIVRERDRDDQAFVLAVLDDLPTVKLIGWIWGRDAKQDRFARPADAGKPPAWFVPQAALSPL